MLKKKAYSLNTSKLEREKLKTSIFGVSNYTMTHKEKMNRYFALTIVAILLGTFIKVLVNSGL